MSSNPIYNDTLLVLQCMYAKRQVCTIHAIYIKIYMACDTIPWLHGLCEEMLVLC
jgi:hypothetical protein